MGDLDDLVKDFLVESHENLDRLDRDFMAMEDRPGDKELLAGVFRAIHTIKGTSGFFGFSRLQAVCHAGENLLSKLRDGALVLDGDMSTALLAMGDRVRSLLSDIEHGGAENVGDDQPLIEALHALATGSHHAPAAAPIATPGPVTVSVPVADSAPAPAPRVVASPVEAHPPHPPEGEPARSGEGSSIADSTLRVDVRLLDRVMNLVGELVLARNRILQESGGIRHAGLSNAATRLDQLTTELQEGVMKTRLQPIGAVWQKLPRIVRDLSKSLGKQIRVEMQGAETELDKTIIEAIKDPLTHMVRNSVDHGVEMPDQRVAAGKPAEGRITLRARHDGGQVVVEIDDDGRGIDPGRVKAKAVEKGVISAEQAAKMSDREAVTLIFAPGFSTAEQVTSISGRGVGMDVVRTNIERIGGTVDVASRPGHGATIMVKIPLTLAIIPALIVTCAGQRFAIPQVSLLELVSVPADKVATQIESVYDARVLRLRGQLLPLVDLAGELRLTPPPGGGPVRVVILQADHRQYGLIVDGVQDTQEIVVKPLGRQLDGIEVFSGATIMGDGRVALIIDPVGLAKRAKVASRKDAGSGSAGGSGPVLTPLLVFRSPDDGRMAVTLAAVNRLEELREDQIERMGNQEVIQYRGGIMPLVRVFRVLAERRKNPRNPDAGVKPGTLPVVVHAHGDQMIGLVVGEILDTVEEDITALRPATRPGIAGCLVVRGKVTELLTIDHVVKAALPALAEA